MNDYRTMLGPYLESKAAIVIVPEVPSAKALFDRLSKEMPKVTEKMGNDAPGPAVAFANPDAATQLWALPDGNAGQAALQNDAVEDLAYLECTGQDCGHE